MTGPASESGAGRVLVVEDDADLRWVLRGLFADEGFEVLCAADGDEALAQLSAALPDVVVTDVRMPGSDGIALLRRCQELDADLPVIVLSAIDDLDTAVGAMKLGAYDYLGKPFDRHRLLGAVHRAAERRRLHREVADLRRQLAAAPAEFGSSDAGRQLQRDLARVAGHTGLAVLLVGESGSGKEVAARWIHRHSPQHAGPFVAIDCGAIPESLAESMLFGHRRGAFTGAEADRRGLFVEADGGTLFLDEIGNLPATLQPRLLRALQERAVRPVGGHESVPFRARLICASNLDLRSAVRTGQFRLDLYHRVAEITIELPPLRSRASDILDFARAFLSEAAAELGRRTIGFTTAAAASLRSHPWPGNLRELRNVVRRAAVLTDGSHIDAADLQLGTAADDGSPPAAAMQDRRSLTDRLRAAQDALEADILRTTLAAVDGNKAAAARELQIDYTTLHRKLKRHGLGTMAPVP